MKNKKFTVNERLHLVEQVTLKLSLEIQAIVRAIKMTADAQVEDENQEVSE
jgi:hypothetical protein|tara:strand:+ start:309 stop:461 length:153 start_codon:yes stop_codon:yes gene_type:complete